VTIKKNFDAAQHILNISAVSYISVSMSRVVRIFCVNIHIIVKLCAKSYEDDGTAT